MGVFDGHGGPACAQVISKRLLKYVAAALLPLTDLKKYINNETEETLLETFNDNVSGSCIHFSGVITCILNHHLIPYCVQRRA